MQWAASKGQVVFCLFCNFNFWAAFLGKYGQNQKSRIFKGSGILSMKFNSILGRFPPTTDYVTPNVDEDAVCMET